MCMSLCAALDTHFGMGQEATVTHGTSPMWSRVENKDKRAFPECLLPFDPGEHYKWECGLVQKVWFWF